MDVLRFTGLDVEFIRVPFAENSVYKLPKTVTPNRA